MTIYGLQVIDRLIGFAKKLRLNTGTLLGMLKDIRRSNADDVFSAI